MNPLVSVIILSRNRSKELRIVLDRVRSLSYPRDRIETIVIDNGSTDETPAFLASQSDVHAILRKDNIGIAGWNEGFNVARGDWLLVLDDDCYLETDGLCKAMDSALSEKADLISFLVRNPTRPSFVFNARYNTGLLAFWGCAALVRRQAMQKLGGFDSNILVWAHELEFMLRFFDAGYRHLYLPSVTAFHMNNPTYSDYKYLMNHHNLAYIAGSRFRLSSAFQALAALFIPIADGIGTRPFEKLFWQLASSTIKGFLKGRLRHYSPVRPSLAKIYVRHFHDLSVRLRLRPGLRLSWPEHRRYFPALLESASLIFAGGTEK